MPVRVPSGGPRARGVVVVVPYRPSGFAAHFGPVVRDWALVRVAEQVCRRREVDLIVLERPRASLLSLRGGYELTWGTIASSGFASLGDVLLNGRAFASRKVSGYLGGVARRYERGVLIDFDPFATFDVPRGWYYWVDEIDDFTKHHRLPLADRARATAKQAVQADLRSVGDATRGAQPGLMHIPNFPFLASSSNERTASGHRYDFGVVGFVTEKTDLEFVAALRTFGSVVFWGKVLDDDTARRLSAMGVSVKGSFTARDIEDVMRSFRVGAIPFIRSLVHGNSPIRYFEYSARQKMVISTVSFGIEAPNLVVSERPQESDIKALMDRNVNWSGVLRSVYKGRYQFEATLARILDEVVE